MSTNGITNESITEREKRISEMDRRRAELEVSVAEARQAYDVAREALISGEAGADDRARDALNTLNTRTSAHGLLCDRLAGARADLEEAKRQAAHEVLLSQVVEASKEADALRRSFEAKLLEAARLLTEKAEGLVEARQRWHQAHKSFTKFAAEVAPGVRTIATMKAKAEDDVRRLEAEVETLLEVVESRGGSVASAMPSLFARSEWFTVNVPYAMPDVGEMETALDWAQKAITNRKHEEVSR